jgi:hypothetical protein
MYKQSLEISRKIGDQQGIASTLNTLSNIIIRKREYEEVSSVMAIILMSLRRNHFLSCIDEIQIPD